MKTIKSFDSYIIERNQQEALGLLDKIIKTEPTPDESEMPAEGTETVSSNEPKRPTVQGTTSVQSNKSVKGPGPKTTSNEPKRPTVQSNKSVKGPGPATPNKIKYDSSKNPIFPSIDNSLSTFAKPKILFTQTGTSFIKTLNWGRHSGHNISKGAGPIGITLLSDTPELWITHSGGNVETQKIGNVLKEQGLSQYTDFPKPNSSDSMIMVRYESTNKTENATKVVKTVVNLLKMYGLVK